MGSRVMEPDDILTYATISPLKNFTTICTSAGRVRSRGIFKGSNPLHFSVPLLLVQFSLASTIINFISFLLKPLRQPIMVSQILGGIILGPSVLGQSLEFSRSFFPLRSFIVLDTLASFGYMMYFFMIGVQMDPWALKKIGKKASAIGILSVAVPMIISVSWSYLLTHYVTVDENIAASLTAVAGAESVLAFPTIAGYLAELKILNSEFGRVALSSSMVSGLFSFVITTYNILEKQEPGEKWAIFMTVSTGIAVALVIVLVFRPAILWKARQSPVGEPLGADCIYGVFLGVLMAGFCSQATGLNILFGPLVFGMAIPPGPPLGSALIEKLDILTSWLFMPLYFIKNGLVMDVFAIDLRKCWVVQFIILLSWSGKFLGAFLPSLLFCKMPAKDAICIGLVMTAQGALELGLFKLLKKSKAIDYNSFVVMCTSMMILTAMVTPVIRYLYDPSKRYAVYKKRTIMHSRPDSELRVFACVHNQENVPTTINLLEALNPTKRSPMCIYVGHLMELVGRASPLLIFHKFTKRFPTNAASSERIVNAFRRYEQSNHGLVSVHSLTSISPYATMHEDVCLIALERRTYLIILHFHKKYDPNKGLDSGKKGIKVLNDNILRSAPCSVVILVDRGLLNNSRTILVSWSPYRVAVLFLGGSDDREALALGLRMAGHVNINLTLVRLLKNGNISSDEVRERKIDNEVVSEFRLSMMGNYRVMYIEEVVMDGSGTVSVIRSMENKYELLVVGRRHDKRSPLISGLADWNDVTELGVIGDLLASADFKGNTTVLVVQQHSNVVDEYNESAQKEAITENLSAFQDIQEEEGEEIPIQRRST